MTARRGSASDLRWGLESPSGVSGALAVVRVWGPAEALDAWMRGVGLGRVGVGSAGLRSLLGVDEGVAARWSAQSLHLTPHGGAGILRALGRALTASGVTHAASGPEAFPEAADPIEAAMLASLARAASPRAVDLLLAQPGRWRAHGAGAGPAAETARDRTLRRLIDPPLVAAVGPANVGKSSLLNALAGRSVSVVADQPGTTRDHVGALVALDGLVVRWADTPGVLGEAAGGIDAEAMALARSVMASADLVLACGDHTAEPPVVEGALRIGLRSDLWPGVRGGSGSASRSGRGPGWAASCAVSAETGEGLAELAVRIRDCLVPARLLADGRPWRFWGAEGPGAGA